MCSHITAGHGWPYLEVEVASRGEGVPVEVSEAGHLHRRVPQLAHRLHGGRGLGDDEVGGEVGAVGQGQDHGVQPQEGQQRLRGCTSGQAGLRFPHV